FRATFHPTWGGHWWGPPIISKREDTNEAAPSATTEDLFQLINETIKNATEGISADDLSGAADTLQALAGSILQARKANVSRDDVRSLVEDVATRYEITLNGVIVVEDPLTVEAKYLGMALQLLYSLREEGLSREGDGESTDVIVAAILAVSEALKRINTNTVEMIRFIAATRDPSDGNVDAGNANANGTETR
ncbi:unnamed protein product, partial [Candidula unifasciata]